MKTIPIRIHMGLPWSSGNNSYQDAWIANHAKPLDPFQWHGQPSWQHAAFPEGEKPLDGEEIWGDSPT